MFNATAGECDYVIDFDTSFPSSYEYKGGGTVVIAENPNGTGNVIHATNSNYDQRLKLIIVLPNEKTSADYESLALDIYYGTTGDNTYKDVKFSINGGSESNIDATQGNLGVWKTIENISLSGLSAATSFTIEIGYQSTGGGNFYIDNLTFASREGTCDTNANTFTATLNAGTGTCTVASVTEASEGAGVTLPSASPSESCATDWTFAGWATSSVSETSDAPTLIAAGEWEISQNTTLYAVYTNGTVYNSEPTCGGGEPNPNAIPFDQHNNILLSDFENYADNRVVTIVLNVASEKTQVGYGLGHILPINAHNETDKNKYEFICTAVSATGEDNSYTFTIAELKAFAKLDGENYYEDEWGQKGISLSIYNENGATLISVMVGDAIEPAVSSLVIDFEDKEIGATYSKVAYNSDAFTAVIVENPTVSGEKSLKLEVDNWGSAPRFSVLLPEGKTLNDIEKVTFNIYIASVSTDINYKDWNCWFGAKDTSFSAGSPTKTIKNNYIGDEKKDQWVAKEFAIQTLELTEAVLALNEFDMAFGIHCPGEKSNTYYLDDITLVQKPGGTTKLKEQSAIQLYNSNGLLHFANARVDVLSIYDINGRLLLSATNISSMDISNLSAGVYIVKAEMGGKPLVEKIIKK